MSATPAVATSGTGASLSMLASTSRANSAIVAMSVSVSLAELCELVVTWCLLCLCDVWSSDCPTSACTSRAGVASMVVVPVGPYVASDVGGESVEV